MENIEEFIRKNFDIIEEDFTSIVYDNENTLVIWEKPSNPVSKLLPLVKDLNLEVKQGDTPYTYLLVDAETQISAQLQITSNSYILIWYNFELTVRTPFQALSLICSCFDIELKLVSQLKIMESETADKSTELKLNALLSKYSL